MKIRLAVLAFAGIVALSLAGCSGKRASEKASVESASTLPQASSARAQLVDASGKAAGEVVFSPSLGSGEGSGVRMTVDAIGLKSGMHAIHIHEKGDCTRPDFKSAGGHFNPTGKEHGTMNPKGHHAGDLPDLTAGKDGKAHAEIVARDLTLEQLLKDGGTAVVIHAKMDDNKSQPAGNAGDRVACGVIQAR